MNKTVVAMVVGVAVVETANVVADLHLVHLPGYAQHVAALALPFVGVTVSLVRRLAEHAGFFLTEHLFERLTGRSALKAHAAALRVVELAQQRSREWMENGNW